MFARAVAGAPRVLLLDEPTRGVDIAAKFDLHVLLREIADAGAAIVLASSDHEELLALCSRIMILRDGRISAPFLPRDYDSSAARALLRRIDRMSASTWPRSSEDTEPCSQSSVIGYFSLELPNTFLTGRNLINISQQMSMLAVVAGAMTVVMAMGDFDLSVGSMASLSGIVAALVFISGGSTPAAIAAALFCGLAGGLVNGFLVSYVGILPFIATLGAMTVYGGLAFKLSGGETLFGAAIPHSFSDFARGGVPVFSTGLVLPNLTLVAIAAVAIIWGLLEQTIVGRRIYAIGDNAEAARLAGVRVRPLRLAAFGIAGLGAAGAGLMYASRVASANPTQGAGLMLDAIAAVFLGQDDDRGGRAEGPGHNRGSIDSWRARQWSDANERRLLRPRHPHWLNRHCRGGDQQLRKDAGALSRD